MRGCWLEVRIIIELTSDSIPRSRRTCSLLNLHTTHDQQWR
jgi:hypothetical protein